MPYGTMDRETELILRENDLDPALITDVEAPGACHLVNIVLDGALDESFEVKSEYAREVVNVLGPIYVQRYDHAHVTVDATHGYVGDPDDETDPAFEASGYLDDYYEYSTPE